MIQITREKTKSLIIILLVVISIVQLGILWNFKTHGLPFSFFTQIFSLLSTNNRIDLNEIKTKYSAPEAIIVSEGLSLYSINRANSDVYYKIWKDFRNNYVKQFKDSKPIEYSVDYWNDIIKRKVFIIEFSTFINTEIFMWLNGDGESDSLAFTGVEKIAIAPSDNVNQSIMTIYINDNVKIYKYEFNVLSGSLSKKDYIDTLDNAAEENKTEKYKLLRDYFPDINFREDILLTNRYNSNKTIKDLYSYIPKKIQFDLRDKSYSDNIDDIMEFVLLEEKDSFNPETDATNNAYLFTEEDSFYRIYQNGLFEYKYLKNTDSKDAGSIKDAFSNALVFMEKHSNLIEETNKNTRLLLRNIKHDPVNKRYHFSFDYVYGEYQIYMRSNQVVTSIMVHAVEIIADSQRILECKWYVREFAEKESENMYKVFFTDVYGDAREIYTDLDIKNLFKENKYVSEYNFGYIVNYNEFDFVRGVRYQPKAIFTQISTEGPIYYISNLSKIEP